VLLSHYFHQLAWTLAHLIFLVVAAAVVTGMVSSSTAAGLIGKS
jgi:hypothetical protein